jgi:nascent polypeptide-associated complex subunit alpha
VFSDPQVTRMDAQGTQTYQVVGEPESREPSAGDDANEAAAGDATADDAGVPEEDVELVATRAGVSTEEAREALAAEDGDLAAAVARFE